MKHLLFQSMACHKGGHEGSASIELTDREDVLLFFSDPAVLQQQSSNGLEKTQKGGSTHAAYQHHRNPISSVLNPEFSQCFLNELYKLMVL